MMDVPTAGINIELSTTGIKHMQLHKIVPIGEILLISKIWNQALHGIPTFFLQLTDHETSNDRFVLSCNLNEFVTAGSIAVRKSVVLTSAKMIRFEQTESVIFVSNLKILDETVSDKYLEARRLHLLGVKVNFIEMKEDLLRDVLQIESSTAMMSKGILDAIIRKTSNQDSVNSQLDNDSSRKRSSGDAFVHEVKSQVLSSAVAQQQQANYGSEPSTSGNFHASVQRTANLPPLKLSFSVPVQVTSRHSQGSTVAVITQTRSSQTLRSCINIDDALGLALISETMFIRVKLMARGLAQIAGNVSHFFMVLMDINGHTIEGRTQNTSSYSFGNGLVIGRIYEVNGFRRVLRTDSVLHVDNNEYHLEFDIINPSNIRLLTNAPQSLKSLELPLVNLDEYTINHTPRWMTSFAIRSFRAVPSKVELNPGRGNKGILLKGRDNSSSAKDTWVRLYGSFKELQVIAGREHVFHLLKVTQVKSSIPGRGATYCFTSTPGTSIETSAAFAIRKATENN